jgi:hypothetical protein
MYGWVRKANRWVHQSNQLNKTLSSWLYQTALMDGTTYMFLFTRQSTSNKNKVKTIKHCACLIGQTIMEIQDTNQVLKKSQISGKYKIFRRHENINDLVGKVIW